MTIGLIYLFNLFYSFENIFFFKSDIRKYQLFKRKEIKERDIFTFTFEKYIVVNDTVKILFEIDPDSSFISANISYFNPTYTISLYDEYEKYLTEKEKYFFNKHLKIDKFYCAWFFYLSDSFFAVNLNAFVDAQKTSYDVFNYLINLIDIKKNNNNLLEKINLLNKAVENLKKITKEISSDKHFVVFSKDSSYLLSYKFENENDEEDSLSIMILFEDDIDKLNEQRNLRNFSHILSEGKYKANLIEFRKLLIKLKETDSLINEINKEFIYSLKIRKLELSQHEK